MSDRLIPSTGGRPVLVYYRQGGDWRPMIVDADGHGQIDVLSLPADIDVRDLDPDSDHVGIWAYTGAIYVPLRCSAGGSLSVEVKASELPSGAATSAKQDDIIAKFQDQAFTYKSQVLVAVSDTDADAGTNVLTAGGPDVGELRVVTNIMAYNATSPVDDIFLSIRTGGVYYYLKNRLSLAASEGLSWQGQAILVNPNLIRATFHNCAAGDDIYLYVNGYDMTLD